MKIFIAPIIAVLFLAASSAGQESVDLLPPAHAEALQKFLRANPSLSFLPESRFDAAEAGMLKFTRRHINAKLTPYYLAADFNRDGFRDFAVILVDDKSPPKDQGADFGKSHRYSHRLLVVVFNGSKSKIYKPVFKKRVEAPLVCFLSLTEEKNPRLYWGIIETDDTMFLNPTRKGYSAEFPDRNY